MAVISFTSTATQREAYIPVRGAVTNVTVGGQSWAFSQSGPDDLSITFAPSLPNGVEVVITYTALPLAQLDIPDGSISLPKLGVDVLAGLAAQLSLAYPVPVSASITAARTVEIVWSLSVNPDIAPASQFGLVDHTLTAHAYSSAYVTVLTLGEDAQIGVLSALSYTNPVRTFNTMRGVTSGAVNVASFNSFPVLNHLVAAPAGGDSGSGLSAAAIDSLSSATNTGTQYTVLVEGPTGARTLKKAPIAAPGRRQITYLQAGNTDLTLAHLGSTLVSTSSGATSVLVPDDSVLGIPYDSYVDVAFCVSTRGAGVLAVNFAAGVTVEWNDLDTTNLQRYHAPVTLVRIGANHWIAG